MPVARLLCLAAPVVLSAAVLIPASVRAAPAPDPTPVEPPRAGTGLEVEVKCVDDSTLKVKVLDDKLDLGTKYGSLQIPVADIRRIDFAHRVPPEVVEKIAQAISKLGHPDFQTRERATADLKALRERAYPYLLKAIKNDDPEVSRRADEAVKFIQARVPASQLEPREFDVVYTDDSRITGKLAANTLRVSTAQFGEQALKLADIRTWRSGTGTALDDLQAASAAPANLMTYQQQFGKELVFSLTGFATGSGQQPSLWGTDVYSLDSNLTAAAVHAGVVRPGETAVVRVRILQSPQQFVGSIRNGITSAAYANYPAGGFEFVRK